MQHYPNESPPVRHKFEAWAVLSVLAISGFAVFSGGLHYIHFSAPALIASALIAILRFHSHREFSAFALFIGLNCIFGAYMAGEEIREEALREAFVTHRAAINCASHDRYFREIELDRDHPSAIPPDSAALARCQEEEGGNALLRFELISEELGTLGR